MKAVVKPNGEILVVADDLPTDPAATRLFTDSLAPVVAEHEVAESHLEDDGETVRRVWTTRLKTDEEAQSIVEPVDVVMGLTDAEVSALRSAFLSENSTANRVATRAMLAIGARNEIRSRSANTKLLVAGLVGIGVLTQSRARELFNDEGVV